MSPSSSSQSASNEPSTAPSSPPSADPGPDATDVGLREVSHPPSPSFLADPRILAAEENARAQNEAQQRRTESAARARKKRAAKATQTREDKAQELEQLLKKSAAFSQILTDKTLVLGRVGSGLDGRTLGEHNLEMAKQPNCMVGGTMRDYQLEGLTWMHEIASQGMSGILADEMGLGKTIQTISLVAILREQESYYGPHLIIAPLSTLSNWMDEFEKWAPSIPVVLYHGSPSERQDLYAESIAPHLDKNGMPTARFPVLCTSYEIIIRDRARLSKIRWEFIIIDEGHRMKNFDSKLFRELREFTSVTRFLITGTPLQNNLRELWSLLHFLLPQIFTDWEAFDSWFDFSGLADEEGTQQFIADQRKQELLRKMHLILQPLLLRRIKADVAAHLPPKREYVLYAPMTKDQTDLYNAISDSRVDTRAFLEARVYERLKAATNKEHEEDEKKVWRRENEPQTAATQAPSSKPSASKIQHIQRPKDRLPETSEGEGNKHPETTLPVRHSSRKNTVAVPTSSAIRKDAFALMMGKHAGPAVAVNGTQQEPSPVPQLPQTHGSKRKAAPAEESPRTSKSARSSRQSTPVDRVREGRQSRGRKSFKDDSSDDDLLDDDEFEAKLAAEAAEQSRMVKTEKASADGRNEPNEERFLEIAKREMANKKLGNPIMQLRLVCNSPHNFYNAFPDPSTVDASIVNASGKMLLLDRLLPALFSRGHKVLIFSQFQTQLDLLEDYCRYLRGWDPCRIDGAVAHEDRRAQIARFNSDPGALVFLLSTRAGGQGINLAAADTVVLFDSDWNPQQDLQAQDRAHRIGQARPVVVFRLATRDTVEDDLLRSADAKRRLEKLVIKKGGFRTMGQKLQGEDEEGLDSEALRRLLLKEGQVYGYADADREVLSDEDLEVLCDRSPEAYSRAAEGEGNAAGYTVVKTGAEGVSRV